MFVKSVEDLNDRLAYKVFENLALDSTQEKRLLSLHIRRKSNDEKKHWLRQGQRRSQSLDVLPKVESRERQTQSEIRYDRERLESTVGMLVAGRKSVAAKHLTSEI